ncbi:hypothetical protein GGR55DRAFT_703576 [Xylaria sp. FL0064]|nr:hypothetical protein GGR55DRAFT_703576 [Xylaria sp. FL0064]
MAASSAKFINKTQILKCNISHRRLFPAQHAFTYPCLSVWVPVRTPKSTWILSVDESQWWKRGWLHVTVKDHFGFRGSEAAALSEALDEYLEREGLDPNKFPHVYLLTIPRFLNYRFSPASFWYLYTADFTFAYLIAEVNNTFMERRAYLFPLSESCDGVFRQRTTKDFHVSPFNSRKGSYQITTSSPDIAEKVSMKVTLFSSKGHPKLVARWWSNVPPIDPSESSVLHLLWCLACWGCTVLIIFPRIVYQALLLAQVHNLHIWYRPEPGESAIPRNAIASEIFLASIFVGYIRFLVNVPRGSPNHNLVIRSSAAPDCIVPFDWSYMQQEPRKLGLVEVRIHGPNFYRQMLRSRRLTELLAHALCHPSKENRTVWSNEAELLLTLIQEAEADKFRQQDVEATRASRSRTLVGMSLSMAWIIHRILMPAAQVTKGLYPNPGSPKERNTPKKALSCAPYDIPPLQPLEEQCFLHAYVRNHCSALEQVKYMIATLSLHLATQISGRIGGE